MQMLREKLTIENVEQMNRTMEAGIARDMNILEFSLIRWLFSYLMSGVQQILLAFAVPLTTNSAAWHIFGSLLSFPASHLRMPGGPEAALYLHRVSCFMSAMLFLLLFLNQVFFACMPLRDSSFFLVSFERTYFNKSVQNMQVRENHPFLFLKGAIN